MLSGFWSEYFWLPANTTWEDISNGPGKAIVYAEAKDYWVQIPLVIVLLTIRFLSERYVFAPLGRYLGISDSKGKKPPPNNKLEAAYRKSPATKNTTALAKQLDLSEREIERWWRLRRRQDKPTTLAKFCENMWKGSQYYFNSMLGLRVVWGQKWQRQVELCFDEYPHQGINSEIKWFYMISSAFYISLIITQFRDVRRKDSNQMYIHHIVTLWLLYCSWVNQCFRIGCLLMKVFDAADVVVEFGKAMKYARFERTVNCMFAVFVFMWMHSRLYFLPVHILTTVFSQPYTCPAIFIIKILLWVIFVLSLWWSCLILKLIIKTLGAGKFEKDLRSSSEDEVSSHKPSNGTQAARNQVKKHNL